MPATYQVALKDQTGARVALFDEFARLRYKRRRNFPGWFRLELDLPDNRAQLFELDGQIEVYRRGVWSGSTWYVDFEGFNRRPNYLMLQSGEERFHSWGPGYLELLMRRHGLYWWYNTNGNTDRGYLRRTGTPPEVVADFVSYEAGPAAAYPDIDRSLPGLTVLAPIPAGDTVTEHLRNDQLLDRLQELADEHALEIRIVGVGAALFEFRVSHVLGTDRRVGNTAGNPPVIFSTGFGNMAVPDYVEDYLGEVNQVYVGGQGEGAARAMHYRTDPARVALSPWNSRESFVDARDAYVDSELQERAIAKLEAGEPIIDLAFQLVEAEASRYGRDFDLGDLVTGVYRHISKDYRVESVQIAVDAQQLETIEVGLVEYAES